MMVYICTKFHKNILNGIIVMERTRKVNGRTDGRTDGGHDIIRRIKMREAFATAKAYLIILTKIFANSRYKRLKI